MREIKFRAWDKIRKKMWSAEEMGQDQEALLPDGRGFANISGDNIRLSQIHSHLLPLQYTGLKDKNGQEIYEGDIVSCLVKPQAEWILDFKTAVKWSEDGLNWNIWPPHSKSLCWEVIGNIYENPELLDPPNRQK